MSFRWLDRKLAAELQRVGVTLEALRPYGAAAGLRGSVERLAMLYRRPALRALRSLPDAAGTAAFVERLREQRAGPSPAATPLDDGA